MWALVADLQVTLGGISVDQRDRAKAVNPLVNTYRAGDGRWLQLAMLQADLSWPDLCRAIERPDLENDPRFDNMETRAEHCEELIRMLDGIFESKDRAEWETRLRDNNCIYGRIESPEEVIKDPQAEAAGIFTGIQHPEAGEVKYITSPVKFCQNPASVRNPAPELGQHTEEILLELGFSWEEIVELKDRGVILP